MEKACLLLLIDGLTEQAAFGVTCRLPTGWLSRLRPFLESGLQQQFNQKKAINWTLSAELARMRQSRDLESVNTGSSMKNAISSA